MGGVLQLGLRGADLTIPGDRRVFLKIARRRDDLAHEFVEGLVLVKAVPDPTMEGVRAACLLGVGAFISQQGAPFVGEIIGVIAGIHESIHHGVAFARAQYAFADPRRVIARDESHSETEERFYCFGEVDGGVLTVRFTWRASVIRIIGAGYWRKGKAIYERENTR